MKSLVLLSVFALLPAGLFLRAPAASPAPATDAVTYTIDNVHSTVMFRVKHMNTSWFYGRFNKFSGSVVYDYAKPENSSVSIEIAADSGFSTATRGSTRLPRSRIASIASGMPCPRMRSLPYRAMSPITSEPAIGTTTTSGPSVLCAGEVGSSEIRPKK